MLTNKTMAQAIEDAQWTLKAHPDLSPVPIPRDALIQLMAATAQLQSYWTDGNGHLRRAYPTE